MSITATEIMNILGSGYYCQMNLGVVVETVGLKEI